MEKIPISLNKTLKLKNACIYRVVDEDLENIERTIYQLDNYIRSKGALPVGPIVQCVQVLMRKESPIVELQLIRQVNTYIEDVEPPYAMQETLCCPNCIFCRFTGESCDLHYAYEKINAVSYEENLALTGKRYTVFIEKSESEFAADIFAEKR